MIKENSILTNSGTIIEKYYVFIYGILETGAPLTFEK